MVAVGVAWVWGHESGYWSGMEEGHHGFLGEDVIDR